MPMQNDIIPLSNRAILTLSGPDRRKFLQTLITNDVEKISGTQAIYAALLTAQGKYLHDFFITEVGESLFLDCERARLPDLIRRLMIYRLRADIDIKDCTDEYDILASMTGLSDGIISCVDPRHAQMGFRTIMAAPENISTCQTIVPYDRLRLSLGLPDGSRDIEVDRTLILEANMAELNGVDFDKGCYVGQEVTARMKYRANLKKRLLPVRTDGPLPDPGTDIINDAGRKIGRIRSGLDNMAMGYFRLAHMEFDQPYTCGEATVIPVRPDWYPSPEQKR